MDKFDVFAGRAYVVMGSIVMAAKSSEYALDGNWWWWPIVFVHVFLAAIMSKDGVR